MDLENSIITIAAAFNTKIMRERTVSVTTRRHLSLSAFGINHPSIQMNGVAHSMWVKRLATLLIVCALLDVVQLSGAQARRTTVPHATFRASQNSSAWERFAPTGEEFAIMLPGQPKVGAESVPFSGSTLALRYYGLSTDETDYVVLSIGVTSGLTADMAYILMLNFYNKVVPTSLLYEAEGRAASVQASYQRAITLNGYAGQEYAIRARNRSGLWHFYNTGEHFYAVVASTARKNNNLVKRFLNSFTLTPSTPTLAAAGSTRRPLATTRQGRSPLREPNETWFVVLRTYSKAEQGKANQAPSLLGRSGYDVHIIDTDNYPNLKKGLLAAAAGPYSKRVAQKVLSEARSVAPGAYIKPGW